ncbi:MAG: NUMOD1 domain-containing DNA-binding protein [Agathobacter sp.]
MSRQSRQEQRAHTKMVVAKYHKLKTPWSEQQFREVFHELHPDIIVEGIFVDMNTPISCYCEKDNNIWMAKPRDIVTDGTGCPVCARKNNGLKYSRATKGVNDFATKYPHLVKYFVNEKEAFLYKYQSNISVQLRCPHCNYEKTSPLYLLARNGFRCPVCGDGVSYPNKIGRMMVLQLPVNDIEFEWHPVWMPGKLRFDIKFKYQDQIFVIEMDGIQHYIENISFTHKKLSAIQADDSIKDNLCKEHHVIMIRIDCMNNSLEWIKEHIMKSELNAMFDLSLIDWAKCEKYASTSLVMETARLWNSGLDLLEISQELKVCRSSIQKYIKTADHLGLCQYDKNRGLINGIVKNSRAIRWIDTNQEFVNCKICAEEVYRQTGIKVTVSGVRAVAYGKQKQTKGFHFEFCDKSDFRTYENISKTIYCYDMSGRYITEYESIQAAAQAMDVTEMSILKCCNGITKKSANHVWRYADQVIGKKDFVVDLTRRGRKIDCLTSDGKYIESFPSAMVAIRKYTAATNSGIGRCCRGTQQLSGGYRWRYSQID